MVRSKTLIASLFAFLLSSFGVWAGPIETKVNNSTASIPGKDDFSTPYGVDILRRAKSAEIASQLHVQTNPCNDFFQFACGNWKRSNPAQLLGKVVTDKFQMLSNAFDRRVLRFLNEPRRGNSLEYQVRDFYQACHSLKNDNFLYRADLEEVYKEFGRMPVIVGTEKWINDGDADEFVWWQAIAKIANKYGKQIIISVNVMADMNNSTAGNRIYVGPPDIEELGTTSLFMILRKASIAHQLEKVFGVNSDLAEQTAKKLVDFEKLLFTTGSSGIDGLTFTDLLTEVKVSDIVTKYGDIFNLQKYLEIIFNMTELPESIYVYNMEYLNNTIYMLDRLSKSTTANYIFWELLQDFLVDINQSDMKSWCVDKTKKYFGKLIDHTIYERYRSPLIEADVMRMWEEIRDVFRDELLGNKLDWITLRTRQYAVKKLNAMKLIINSYDTEDFNLTYGTLNIDRLNHVKNIQEVLKQESRQKYSSLDGKPNLLESTEELSFTPIYNLLDNTIKIPVALLQPRYFWDIQYPQALKYGTLGYLIAHEMIHGFDEDGKNYDENGTNLEWWDEKSTFGFEIRRKCFQAQYHNYTFGGKKLPDNVDQSENIADNAAVKIAHIAYTRWLTDQRINNDAEEALAKERLPGLNYTSQQLFFMAFAQVWCNDIQTLFRSSIASTDTHAPSKFRVIGALSNYQEFAWSYHCPRDAAMDPEYKCAIY